MLSERCVVSDFSQPQLPCSGEWEMRTDIQNGVGIGADVCKHAKPASTCLESRRFAQHKDSRLVTINVIKSSGRSIWKDVPI